MDRRQLTTLEQSGQAACIPAVGLDPIAGCPWDQGRGRHQVVDPQGLEEPSELEAGRAGFITDAQPPSVAEAIQEAPDRHLIVEEPLELRGLPTGLQHPRGDRVLVDIQAYIDRFGVVGHTAHGRLLAPYVAPSASSWMTHACRGPEPAVPC